ncbi:MAG: twin-arginine translocase TatA/TatE family subunit [Anaerolineae bacterium]
MPQLGPTELIIILVIVILVFGVGKLPEVGGALGKSIKEFKSASKELEGAKKDIKTATDLKSDE